MLNPVFTRSLIPAALLLLTLASCSPKINPDRPVLAETRFNLDSLPNSELNIPVQISLKPIYQYAEKSVDTLFTSPGWPDGWVQDGCDTRYKYSFRRSPLKMSASGNIVNLGFTGYYKIVGSTRVCAGSTILSPWTPPCRCGFDEPERRVNVGFSSMMRMMPDYRLFMVFLRKDPEPLDKCEVCFWGQNITGSVLKGLTTELDASKKAMEDSFGTIYLKSSVQKVWDQLNNSYSLYNLGWLQLNPQKLRINQFSAARDTLTINLGLSAKPVISFEKQTTPATPLPNLSEVSTKNGFNIFLDAVLDYDSLSTILNSQVSGKRFDLDKGPVKKYIVVKEVKLYGTGNEKLIIKLDFTGSENGTVYLTGKPVYDKVTKKIEVKGIDFDVKTRDLLVRTAGWLFNKKITSEIQHYSSFDLSSYIETAKKMVNQQLNKEWVKGVRSAGSMDDISIVGFYPFSKHLVVRSNFSGNLAVKVESIDFSF